MSVGTGVVALAAVSRTPGQAPVLQEVALRSITPEEVLVDIEEVGLCHADIAANDGDFPVGLPIVLGHEGCGRVRAVGADVRGLAVGDRVVLTYDHCGRCEACGDERPTHCAHYLAHNFPDHGGAGLLGTNVAGAVVNGGFFGQSSLSTVAIATERNAIRVDTDLPSAWLAPLGCGVQTGTGTVLNVAQPSVDDALVVVGLGTVGFSVLLAARSSGVRSIVVIDLDHSRLALAREFGATLAIDAGEGPWAEAVAAKLGRSVDTVIECSGSPDALDCAVASLRPGGQLVLVGVPAFGSATALDVAAVVNKSIRIRGTVEGDSLPFQMIPALVREIESGRLPIDKLIETHPFSAVSEHFDPASAGSGSVKPVFVTSE